jgi:hypothetical protein
MALRAKWQSQNYGNIISSTLGADHTGFHHGWMTGIFQNDQRAMIEANFDLCIAWNFAKNLVP